MSNLGSQDKRALNTIQLMRKMARRGLLGTLEYISKQGFNGIWQKVNSYLQLSRVHYVNSRFDKQHRVDTWRGITPSQMKTDSGNIDHSEIYTPMPEKTFHYVLTHLNLDFSDYTFVDFGAGKGKVLLMAANYPFKEIIGVEFASNLHEIAEHNIANYRNEQKLCSNITVSLDDACNFRLPEGKCLLFLFAPFKGPVLENVLENIRQSLIESPRSVVLCYVDDDLPYSTIWQVDAIVEKWGILTRRIIGEIPPDPGSLMPMTGTFWLTS